MRAQLSRISVILAAGCLLVSCAGGSDTAPVGSTAPVDSAAPADVTSVPSTQAADVPDVTDGEDLSSMNCAGTGDDLFPVMPCDEPHASEFVGTAPSPFERLPEDRNEAVDGLYAACRPLVEDFLGRAIDVPGPGVGVNIDAELGGPVNGDVECFVSTGDAANLVGLIADVGFEAALNGVIVINDTDPGSCFQLGEVAFDYGTPVDCTATDALMFVGSFDLDDGPYPGDDAIRSIRGERCAEVLADSGLAADPATVSGGFPGEKDWRRADRRTVTCDASPL